MNQTILTMEFKPLLTDGIIIVNVLAVLVLFFYVLYQKRYYLRKLEKEKLDASFREELLRVQLEIQDKAMKNAAQRFHDIIGQEMSLVKLNLGTTNTANQVETETKIAFSTNILGNAIRELRDLSKSLHADNIMKMGLYKAISMELEKIQQSGNIQTHLFADKNLPEIDTRRGLILFRIVQEFLQNITQQASAKNIHINIVAQNDKLMLTIWNDGKQSRPGINLESVLKRADLINANLKIENSIDNGTTVSIFFPLGIQNLIV